MSHEPYYSCIARDKNQSAVRAPDGSVREGYQGSLWENGTHDEP